MKKAEEKGQVGGLEGYWFKYGVLQKMRTGNRIGQNPDAPIDKLIEVKIEVY